MFVGVEIDPNSGSVNNDGSVFTEPSLKKAVKHMKKHLNEVFPERDSLEGVSAYILDLDAEKVVVDLAVYDKYAELQASLDVYYGFSLSVDYYNSLKTITPKNIVMEDILVFKRWEW